DTSFNSGSSTDAAGTHVTSIGTGDSVAHAIALQADGSIVVAGYATNNNNQQFALARYTSGGDLDTSFNPRGDNGAAPGTVMTFVDSAISAVQALAVQPDGRIVAAGSSTGGTLFKVALVRYGADGTPDTHFGPNSDGRVATAVGTGDSLAYGMTLDADGKIIVAGQASQGGSKGFALVRYNADGTLDAAFGSSGTVITPITGLTDARAEAVAMEPDGKIVAAGFGVDGSNRRVVAVARYTANGTLDTTFGSGGIQTTAMGADDARAHAIALQTDGKIIVAGSAVSSTGNNVMGTARYLAADTPWVLTPDAFHFDNIQRAVVPNTVQTSKMITVSGLGPGIQVPVTVSDGEYAKNGASAYTVNRGWARNGDQFNVRHTSIAGEINTTLTIGGMVSANNSKIVLGKTTADAFSSLSVSILGGSGALAGLSLAILALAWGLGRRRSGP
ncbi:MAG TPA: delta-60 repeat domain-containing protein, partial [Gammaproteobacteria bacterium]|nr:delta-60 repeat domain-containing protein [Gammaproteobacteria bacterium]